MTDLMTLDFLIKCKKRLEKHGVFIIKENIPNLTFFNNKSSKKCRSLDGYIMLFNLAKLEILKIKKYFVAQIAYVKCLNSFRNKKRSIEYSK